MIKAVKLLIVLYKISTESSVLIIYEPDFQYLTKAMNNCIFRPAFDFSEHIRELNAACKKQEKCSLDVT